MADDPHSRSSDRPGQLDTRLLHLARVIDDLDDLVFEVDAQGYIQHTSQAVTRYGYELGEILGRHFSELVHEADVPGLLAMLDKTLRGAVQPYVFRARTKSGEERIVRATSRAVVREGKVVGVAGVMIDISELKRTEEALRAAQKMEAVGRLAGGVAHDFNNLLSVIMSYTSFVKDAAVDPQQRADAEEIEKAADRAAALTRQLLAFSRRQVLEPRVLDLSQLTSDLEKLLRRLIGEDVELIKRLDPKLGKVRADPGQIEQVIMNLAVNARDAMPDGGTLTIETSNVDLDDSHVPDHPALKPGSYVLLAVSDTGCGMDEVTKQRLFEPFYTTKEVGKGTGLGLSTVYGIVEQSGGVIAFTSEAGLGTTFKVYLPRTRISPSSVRGAARAERLSHGHETILLVEDEPTVRMLAERALRKAGYAVLAASGGEEAIELFREHGGRIDLLLTDVVMPQMNGRVLAQRLHELSPELPVLFMSGYTDNVIERHGVLEHGMQYIAKPFNGGTLTAKVRHVLDGGGGER